MHRLTLGALSVLAWLQLVSASAAGEVELSLGGGIGSSFTRRGPFEFDGLQFLGSPYRRCPLELDRDGCAFFGLTDVEFSLQRRYTQLGVAGLEARGRVAGALSIGAGALVGLALGQERLWAGDTGELVGGRPLAGDVETATEEIGLIQNGGIGRLAYLHTGVRVDRGFRRLTSLGTRPTPVRVFLEGGGGWLASVPGGKTAGIGRPPAMHIAGGLSVNRGLGRTLFFTLRHVRALHKPDEAVLLESQSSWTVFQVGWSLR